MRTAPSLVVMFSILFVLGFVGGLPAQETPRHDGEMPAGDAAQSLPQRDPAKLTPDSYKVALDNDKVRVLDVRLKPGERTPMHAHPQYLVYVVTDGKARFTEAGGATKDVDFKAGQAMQLGAESHTVENIGPSELHVLHVEFKGSEGAMAASKEQAAYDQAETAGATMQKHVMATPEQSKWTDGPAGLPRGAKAALLEGDPSQPGPFALRLKFPANYTIPPHWHPADEHVTVLSGALYMGMGETLERAKATSLGEGSYAVMPKGMRHFAYTEGESEIQLHGIGPWGINYVNPADDPRQAKSQ
jgi:quercetin dioxygenase-like cupin family protein